MEPVENQGKQDRSKKEKSTLQGDRITLGKVESLKLDTWICQIEEKTNGMVKLTKSELVNYLLQRKEAELSQSELNQIRKDNYDEVRFAYWALTKIKEAKKAGETITLEDLMRVQKGQSKSHKVGHGEVLKQHSVDLKTNETEIKSEETPPTQE